MSYLVLGNLTCAVLLAISGMAKLAAMSETRDAFKALRLPGWLRRSPAPALLPWGELLLALVLVLGSGWVLVGGAVASVALFGTYTFIIARALRFDEPVRCNCFGALGSHDVSPRTLARNVLFLLLALLGFMAVIAGEDVYGLDADGWGWLAMSALSALVVTLSLLPGPQPEQAGGPAASALGFAPNLALTDVDSGERVRLRALGREHGGAVLLFVVSGCGGCERVLDQLPQWLEQVPGRAVIPVRPSGSELDDPKWKDLAHLHEDWGSNVAQALGGAFTPSAVELDAAGSVMGSPVTGEQQVRDLILRPVLEAAAAAVEAEREPVAVAPEPAVVEEEDDGLEDYERLPIPDGVLLRPDGEPITLRALAGQQAQLLVTINCLCSPARAGIAAIEEWQTRLPVLQVRLVPSIRPRSAGTIPAAVERVSLYDHAGLAAKALGATGQVAAVLLGADGMIAGGPVTGIDEVEQFVADIEAQLPPAE
ncbi:hypothetical protein H5399_08240 [Tessaracoccus sp. MC1627]|uniref:TlpA family protein disulfide reductase n=1 Tax=Tessaracoccus sp. MC1627 TaxID=2760312 RepID=UPI001602D4BB|nr:MauE/DoxX family redox-associated membrane protein [Tessaracoccus sp. MC1627]MBB1512591.1 hypothetical protein [Tessaracoccus sp. MC1627]